MQLHRDPSSDCGGLPIHLTFENGSLPLPSKADFVVVGGGIIGLLTAIGLRESGRPVVLLEAKNLGSGQSGRNLGFIRAQGRLGEELDLLNRSHELWPVLASKLGAETGFQRGGHLSLARTKEQLSAVVEWQAAADGRNISFVELSSQSLQTVFSWLSPEYQGAGFTVEDAQADPASTMRALANYTRQIGVEIIEHTRVTDVIVESRKVLGIATNRGRITTSNVLLAAGAWTRRLLRRLGITLPTHAGVMTMAATCPVDPVSGSTVWEIGQLGFRQDRSGRIIFGLGGYVDVPVRFEDLLAAPRLFSNFLANRKLMRLKLGRPLMQDFADLLRTGRLQDLPWMEYTPNLWQAEHGAALLQKMVPDLASKVTIEQVWTGMIDVTSDRKPAVGNGGIEGLTFVGGLSGHGFGLAPALTEEVVNMVVSGLTSKTMHAFRPDRLVGYRQT